MQIISWHTIKMSAKLTMIYKSDTSINLNIDSWVKYEHVGIATSMGARTGNFGLECIANVLQKNMSQNL